jgi:hypothetical protein
MYDCCGAWLTAGVTLGVSGGGVTAGAAVGVVEVTGAVGSAGRVNEGQRVIALSSLRVADRF